MPLVAELEVVEGRRKDRFDVLGVAGEDHQRVAERGAVDPGRAVFEELVVAPVDVALLVGGGLEGDELEEAEGEDWLGEEGFGGEAAVGAGVSEVQAAFAEAGDQVGGEVDGEGYAGPGCEREHHFWRIVLETGNIGGLLSLSCPAGGSRTVASGRRQPGLQ